MNKGPRLYFYYYFSGTGGNKGDSISGGGSMVAQNIVF